MSVCQHCKKEKPDVQEVKMTGTIGETTRTISPNLCDDCKISLTKGMNDLFDSMTTSFSKEAAE